MNATAIGIIVSGIVTLAAVIFTHVLNQRAGEKRANQVREEVLNRIDAVNTRVTEVRETLAERIADTKADLTTRISELRSQTESQASQIRAEISNSATGIKEIVTAELRATRAEILAAMPERARSVGTEQRT